MPADRLVLIREHNADFVLSTAQSLCVRLPRLHVDSVDNIERRRARTPPTTRLGRAVNELTCPNSYGYPVLSSPFSLGFPFISCPSHHPATSLLLVIASRCSQTHTRLSLSSIFWHIPTSQARSLSYALSAQIPHASRSRQSRSITACNIIVVIYHH